jgi:ubiquinone/menaquinone biosynthesis C-methylase UbiE
MSNKRVNYDQIASTYNQRYTINKEPGIAAALQALARDMGAERVLEVGCGTGRWLADLQPVTPQLYGLDFSYGMLRQACQQEIRPYLVQGTASRLSFPDAVFDLVYCVNAIHHFDDPRVFVSEARRLLRPGGALVVIGMDPHGRLDHYYHYQYFDGAYETDVSRCPSWGTILDWLVTDGFEQVEWQIVERILNDQVGRQVLDDPFLQKNAVSSLALLTDEAYAAGLRRIEAALAEAEAAGRVLVFPIDIPMGMLVARQSKSGNRSPLRRL